VQTSLGHKHVTTYLYRESNFHRVNGTSGQAARMQSHHISDEAGFEQIFRQYHTLLCRYAYAIVKDTVAAEEIVQDVFLKIWERRTELEITVSVKSYLYRSVHNGCLNAIAKKKKEVHMDEVSLKIVHQSAVPAADLQTKELEIAISAGLDRLPVECRKIFELSRFGELKYREIAETLGISIKTVENQMGKALRIMREQLAGYLPMMFPFILYYLFQFIPFR
jgi:RNA polymerase sigma-70 factor (family 1)